MHPKFFDGLNKLKLIEFDVNLCIKMRIGCETWEVGEAVLKRELRECFGNCSDDSNGLGFYQDH
jgi:hypothetical protein